MSLYRITISGDGETYIADVNKKRDLVQWFGTYNVYGNGGNNFGGGTITFTWSTNGGTTKVPLKDTSGNSMTSAADDNFTVNLAGGNKNGDAPKLYASMSGSTNPSVTVDLLDNNG